MKLPEYSIKREIIVTEIANGQGDPMKFPAGTLVFPFWNENNLPSHIFDILKNHNRWNKEQLYIMCVIGVHWVPVLKENIRSN